MPASYRPADPADCVYFSYALTMIPDWRRAIDNAIAMLAPGGTLGVVDFHLPDAGLGQPASGVPGSATTVCGCQPSTCPTCATGWIKCCASSAAVHCPICPGCACPTTCSSGASDDAGALDLPLGHPPRHARLPGAAAARFPQGVRLRAPVPGRRHRRLLGHGAARRVLVAGDEHLRAESAQARAPWGRGDPGAGQPRRAAARVRGRLLRRHPRDAGSTCTWPPTASATCCCTATSSTW